MKKIVSSILVVVLSMICLAGCSTQADRVSENISQQADNFNVIRRLTVVNSRSDKVLYELVAAFSIETDSVDGQLEVVSEVGPNQYKKDFIRLNDWTTYVVQDLSGANVSKYHYEFNILPQMLIPVEFISED